MIIQKTEDRVTGGISKEQWKPMHRKEWRTHFELIRRSAVEESKEEGRGKGNN